MRPFACLKCGKSYAETLPECSRCGFAAETTRQIAAAAEPLVNPCGGPVPWNYSGELTGPCPVCGCDRVFRELTGRELAAFVTAEVRNASGGFRGWLTQNVKQSLVGLLNRGRAPLYRMCAGCAGVYAVCRACMRPTDPALYATNEPACCKMCGTDMI